MMDLAKELRVRVSEAESLRHADDEAAGPRGSKHRVADRVVADFFDHAPVMLVVADLVEGRFLRFNATVCDVLGYSERELLEVSFLDRVHPDDRTRTMLEMERLSSGKQTSGFRNRHLDAGGTYRVFEWMAIADESREMCYAIAIEITE